MDFFKQHNLNMEILRLNSATFPGVHFSSFAYRTYWVYLAPSLPKSDPTMIQYCVTSDQILELKPPENEIIANLEPSTVVKKCSKSLLRLKENSALVTQDS